MQANAVVMTAEQFEILKQELLNQARRELRQQAPRKQHYQIIKAMVNERFTRRDLGHAHNPNAVSCFSHMVRDAFKLAKITDLTQKQGEAAVKMVTEMLGIVDKYVDEGNDNEKA